MKQTRFNAADAVKRILTIPKMDLSGLHNFFRQEEMPLIEPTPIGRHRLLQAFRNKFGESYRNKQGVMQVIQDFDRQRDFIIQGLKARK
jgi:hypothetical protein